MRSDQILGSLIVESEESGLTRFLGLTAIPNYGHLPKTGAWCAKFIASELEQQHDTKSASGVYICAKVAKGKEGFRILHKFERDNFTFEEVIEKAREVSVQYGREVYIINTTSFAK